MTVCSKKGVNYCNSFKQKNIKFAVNSAGDKTLREKENTIGEKHRKAYTCKFLMCNIFWWIQMMWQTLIFIGTVHVP
jgi:hypothetical protein